MNNKEEKAREYRLKANLNTERYLEGGSNIEKAYIAGWDAAKQETIECLKTILSLRSDVHPVVSKHIIELVEREMEE